MDDFEVSAGLTIDRKQLRLLGRVLKFDSGGVMAETIFYHVFGFHPRAGPARYYP